jgi:N-acylneuraminate cytidylyltransferase
MKKNVAVIPARKGSEGIKNKNITDVCGKPLIAWSILHASLAEEVDSVWVTSDGDNILDIASQYGANIIKRPENLSTSSASSESAWLHAIDEIEKEIGTVDTVIGMQPTSPIRESIDVSNAINFFYKESLDSLLTVSEIEDYFIWEDGTNGPKALNYNQSNRKPRQEIKKSFLENGSFYIFKPELLRNLHNRLGGKIGMHIMEKHKMFQIDNYEDIKLCESVMRGYNLDIYG